MNLKAGEKVYLSSLGHRGFIYPTTRCVSLVEDIDVPLLAWVGGGDKFAVMLPAGTRVMEWSLHRKMSGPAWVKRK